MHPIQIERHHKIYTIVDQQWYRARTAQGMNFLCQQQKFSRGQVSFSELNGLEASFDRTIEQRDKRTALSVVTIGD